MSVPLLGAGPFLPGAVGTPLPKRRHDFRAGQEDQNEDGINQPYATAERSPNRSADRRRGFGSLLLLCLLQHWPEQEKIIDRDPGDSKHDCIHSVNERNDPSPGTHPEQADARGQQDDNRQDSQRKRQFEPRGVAGVFLDDLDHGIIGALWQEKHRERAGDSQRSQPRDNDMQDSEDRDRSWPLHKL